MTSRDDLSNVTGYQVETRDGKLGRVAAVLPRVGGNASGALLVHTGRLACRLTAIPFDEVEDVDVDARRVVLRARLQTKAGAITTAAGRSA
jgi:hypothetical protein